MKKKYINIYLDESGNANSHFVNISGFYIIDESIEKIKEIEKKITDNILDIEKEIKIIRQKEDSIDEIKWDKLNIKEKIIYIKLLKKQGQKNTTIIHELNKKNNKDSKKTIFKSKKRSLILQYNKMFRILLERIIVEIIPEPNEYEVIVNAFIDERDIKVNFKRYKKEFLDLKKYIISYCNKKRDDKNKLYKFNIEFELKLFNSKDEPLIRYSDFFAGIIASTCRTKNETTNPGDEEAIFLYNWIHKKIPCICHRYLSKENSYIVHKIHLSCKKSKKWHSLNNWFYMSHML